MAFKMSRSRRLMLVIAVSLSFFLAEISGEFIYLFSYEFYGVEFSISITCYVLACLCLLANFTDTDNPPSKIPVGFYTHSLALVADAFHYVCV